MPSFSFLQDAEFVLGINVADETWTEDNQDVSILMEGTQNDCKRQ